MIRIQTDETFIVRPAAADEFSASGYCEGCAALTPLLSFDQAVSYSGIGGRELMAVVQAEAAHSIEAESGHLLICRRSLEGLRQRE
ncbi:MAG: hypothetical protein ACK4S4_11180 [Pyrinomonadaceae bacterium]